jgi:hypothetical protein
MKRNIKYIIVGLSAALALVSCTGQNSFNGGGGNKDVEKIQPKNADSYELINNVDKYPNIVIVCVHGVAFVTTTRDAQAAIQHIVEMDRNCPGYVAPAAR